MNKQELANALAEKLDLSVKETGKVLDETFAVIGDAVLKGEVVKVPGFGIFEVKERAERRGVKPGTTEEIVIPAKKVVRFKTAKSLKERL